MTTPSEPSAPPSKPHGDIKHAASPESLDTVIVTTKPRAWLALWAIAGAVAIGLIWSLVAVIPLQKSASGVVSPYIYTRVVTATTAGIFTSSHRSAGGEVAEANQVTEGALLGTITPYDGSAPVDVLAPVDGSIASIYVNEGSGVEPGTELLQLIIEPNRAQGLAVTAWVPQSTATALAIDSTSVVSVTDTATNQSYEVSATLESKSNVPATAESIATISGSPDLARQWTDEAGGAPYRIDLIIDLKQWPSEHPYPTPGSVVDITSTYAELHPIQVLFGGA